VMYRAVEFDRKRHQQTARHASRVPRCWRNYVAGSHESPGQCRIGDIKQLAIPAKPRKQRVTKLTITGRSPASALDVTVPRQVD
jgi:hypothetical protein